MRWYKKGLIYKCDNRSFFKSHTTRPIPVTLDDERIRIFFSSRDERDMPYPTYIDVSKSDPKTILHINEEPLLQLGRAGTFDDSGITPVSILIEDHRKLMYYVGWKRRRYAITIEPSIGVASINDTFNELSKVYEGPILSQDYTHPLFVAAPFVVRHINKYLMWYCSGLEWRSTETGPEMIYTVFSADSDDGIHWKQIDKKPLITQKFDGEIVSAPWVIKSQNQYQMWYSTRGYANKVQKNFKIGYAVSENLVNWKRLDHLAGIQPSKKGWDSEMVCYPALYDGGNSTLLFYSGNGSGRGGIGYAVAENNLEMKRL